MERSYVIAIAAGALLVIGVAAVWTLVDSFTDSGRPRHVAPPAFRGQMQEFQAHATPARAPKITFENRDGQTVSLVEFEGRVVILNLWATWCGPCVEELPALDRLQTRLAERDLSVIALSVDRQGAPIVGPFLAKLGVRSLDLYVDAPGESLKAFQPRGLPTTVVIGRDGRELGRLEGAASWDSPEAEALIRHYLDAPRQHAPSE
jgi:thiol-disulfide isomerase/thioredoxin